MCVNQLSIYVVMLYCSIVEVLLQTLHARMFCGLSLQTALCRASNGQFYHSILEMKVVFQLVDFRKDDIKDGKLLEF